jgi:hypothetical protein
VHTGFWWRYLLEREHVEDHFEGVDGRRVLEWIFKKLDESSWTGLMWLRVGTRVASYCEFGNVPSGSIKYGEFFLTTC